MSFKKSIVLILLFAVLPNLNSVLNGYNLDDDFVTEKNVTILGLKSIKEIFTTHYIENKGGYSYEYRPITKLSFAIEHQFFGINSTISHFINLLLYGTSCILLSKLLQILLGHKHYNIAFLATIIFALFPVHTEVVASLKNRDILLCSIFCFLTSIKLLSHKKLNVYDYIFSAVFFLTAILSKLDAMAFCLLIPSLHFVIHKSYKKSIIYFLILTLCFFCEHMLENYLLSTPTVRSFNFYENPFVNDHSLINKLIIGFYTLGFYLKQIIFPVKLVSYYGYNVANFSSVYNPLFALGLTVFLASIYSIVKFKKQQSLLLISFLFLFIYVAMYSNVLALVPGVVADRYAFFSSIGIAILLAAFILQFKNDTVFSMTQISTQNKIVFTVLIVFFCFTSFKRNTEWKDRLTLFTVDSKKAPQSYKLLSMLATEQIQTANNQSNNLNVSQRQQLILSSYQNFLKANTIYDKDYETLNNLGYFEMNYQKNYALAINYYKMALTINSNFADVYYNLGIAYKKNNELDSSLFYLNKCVSKFSNFTPAYDYLISVYQLKNDSINSSKILELKQQNNLKSR